MNFQKEKFIHEVEREDGLKKIQEIISQIGLANLERPATREGIIDAFKNLINKVKEDEVELTNNYQEELTQQIIKSREELAEFSKNNLGQTFFDKKITPEEISKSVTSKIEPQKTGDYCQEIVPLEQVKTKTILEKAPILFNQISKLRHWISILTFAFLTSSAGLAQAEKSFAPEQPPEQLKTEIFAAKAPREIKSENFSTFSEKKLDYLLEGLANCCGYIKFIRECFPEIFEKNKLGFVLKFFSDSNISNSPKSELVKHCLNDSIAVFEEELWPGPLENLFKATYFSGEKFKFMIPEDLRVPEYLCFVQSDYTSSQSDSSIEFKLTFTLLNTESGEIKEQFSVSLDPGEEDKKYIQAVYKQILDRIEKLKTEPAKIKLIPPSIKRSTAEEAKIDVDKEKAEKLTPEEQSLYKTAAELIKNPKIECIVETPEHWFSFVLEPTKETMTQPIKIAGKLNAMDFCLPAGQKLKVLLNNQEVPLYWTYEKDGERHYVLGDIENFGSAAAVSQEKELVFSVIDKNGKEIGRFSLEQIPEWFAENFYYQNVKDQPDSMGVYITDSDTLKIYERLGKEKILENLGYFVRGAVDIEKFFNLDLDLQKVRLGSNTETENAFTSPGFLPYSINCSGPFVENFIKQFENKEKLSWAWKIIGRHESLHVLDYYLGEKTKDSPALSFKPKFKKIFEKLRDDWDKPKEQSQYQSLLEKNLFYWIREGNFFPELGAAGHPWDDPREFFVSLLNITISDPEKLIRDFPGWPQNVKNDYSRAMETVIELLKEKKVDTPKLEKILGSLSGSQKK